MRADLGIASYDYDYISLIHHNVQSLGNSVNQLEVLLEEHVECKFLCITEHWKSEQQLMVHGFRRFRLVTSFCREEGQHGGAAIYGSKDLKFKVLKKVNNLSICGEFECAAAEFTVNNCQVIVITIYRPPNGRLEIFFSKLELLLSRVFEENKLILIAGDLNIEMKNDNRYKEQLFSLTNSFDVHATINEYTRVCRFSKSCIDNIFTNSTEYFEANIINTHISDHTAQKIRFKVKRLSKDNHVTYRRFFSENNKHNFLNQLHGQTWDEVYNCRLDDVNKQWVCFINNFKNIFNECFPKKLVKVKSNNKTYYNGDNQALVECKNRLDILLVISRNDGNYKQMYNEEKVRYNGLLLESRKSIYENKIVNSDNKSKCMWSIHNEITGKQNKDDNFIMSGNPESIANDYNNYLLSIVPDLLANLNKIPFECNIADNNQSIFLKPLSTTDLLNIAKNLKNKHSSGEDEIPTSIVKFCMSEIKEVFCHILNNSFKFGIFPSQLKLASIKPIYKKGNIDMLENYRPISMLPSFSKLFEMAMCVQLVEFMNSCQLFNNTQHGYLKGRSTQTAIFQFTSKILEFMENKKIALGMFLDLSKAYDCLDHNLLLIKLEKYGIRGNALEWVRSYLSDRQQMVKIEKNGKIAKSKILSNNIGIPQGSIMGPILFIIYVNDLGNVVTKVNHSVTNYADDNNILVGAETYPELIQEGNYLFSATSNWYDSNRFILNMEKTNTILFRTKQLRIVTPENIIISGEQRNLAQSTKFLGIQIDEFLSWENHIDCLCLKLNKICYSIRIINKYLNDKGVKIIYSSNFEAAARYGIIFWGSNAGINKIFIIQKRVIRVMLKMTYTDSCRGVFKRNNIMTIYGLYIYECLLFIFKNKDRFLALNTQHEHNTRTRDITYPQHNLTLTEKGPLYMCIKLFNKIPSQCKNIVSINQFKRQVKKMMLNLEPYNLEEFFLCTSLL